MADAVRIRRVAVQIRAEVSQILRDEVRDPRVRLLTVTRVKVAADLGSAVVFYSPLGEEPSEARRTELEGAMRAAGGFVRRLLSRRLELRHTPELRFVLDDSIAQGSQTLELIRSLDIATEDEAPEDEAPEGEAPREGADEEGAGTLRPAEKSGDDGETQPQS